MRTVIPPTLKRISPLGCTPGAFATRHAVRTAIHPQITRMAGFSYIEVLVATVLIAIVLVPAMDALLPGMAGGGIHETRTEDHYKLLSKIEEVLAEPFADLDAAAIAAGSPTTATLSYSDTFTYPGGRQITRNIFLSRYDGDNADADDDPFTGVDEGLLWVQGVIAGSSLRIETLTSVYD